MRQIDPQDIIIFWQEAGPKKWYDKNVVFDALIAEKFNQAHISAKSGAYDDWSSEPPGMMALLILLDQFPRNLYRDSALAFAADTKALALAHLAIQKGYDRDIEGVMRQWFYMPLMHSENMADQDLCLALTERAGLESTNKWAVIHADIIRRFGRFPHRNHVLGRKSTLEELDFLNEGGFSG